MFLIVSFCCAVMMFHVKSWRLNCFCYTYNWLTKVFISRIKIALFAHFFSLFPSSWSVGRNKNLRPLWRFLWEVHSSSSTRPTSYSSLKVKPRTKLLNLFWRYEPRNTQWVGYVGSCCLLWVWWTIIQHPTVMVPVPEWQLKWMRYNPHCSSTGQPQGALFKLKGD